MQEETLKEVEKNGKAGEGPDQVNPVEIPAGHRTPPELFRDLTPLQSSEASFLTGRVEAYRDVVRKALGNLRGKYVGACWTDKSADGFADSIEGAINLFNREPDSTAADWADSQTRMMWSIQKPDGVIEAWHGDGNFARTSLVYAVTISIPNPDGILKHGMPVEIFLEE